MAGLVCFGATNCSSPSPLSMPPPEVLLVGLKGFARQELLEVLELVGARLFPVALQGYAFIGAKGSRPEEEVADWADVRGPNGIRQGITKV